MAEELKYKTLAELKAAYESGELHPDRDDVLVIDNDCAYVYARGEDESGCGDVKVFDGGMPEALLDEALTMLGIPHRGA